MRQPSCAWRREVAPDAQKLYHNAAWDSRAQPFPIQSQAANLSDVDHPPMRRHRRRLPVDLVLPGESSQSMTAFAAPLARFLPEGDALHEGVGNRGSRRRAGTRWAVSPAPSARKPAVAVRGAPCQRAARRRTLAARGRGSGDRALHRVRRPALWLCPHLLRRLRPRLPARVLVQNEVLLPELPPEARAALRRLGRGERARAGGAPPVRVLPSRSSCAPPSAGSGRGWGGFAASLRDCWSRRTPKCSLVRARG